MNQWWRRGAKPMQKGEVLSGQNIPKPTSNLGHKAGYRFDDWNRIEQFLRFGSGKIVVVTYKCVACGINQKFKHPIEILDEEVKFLCEDCQMIGFHWASELDYMELAQCQVVKTFKDDTLVRELKHSVNHTEGMHKAIDEVEKQARHEGLKIKKKKLDLENM